ncbi:MAG: hypothetical protein K6F07_01185 [Bacilli bacterium]|nr:hypothetical protein [Bacilli bacterium]
MKNKLLPLLIASLLLTGCNNNKKKDQPVTPIEEETIIVKAMDTYVYDLSKKTSMDVYFRKDTLKSIPYISLATFYKTLLNKDLEIKETSSGVFNVKAPLAEAIIDTNTDTLSTDNYQDFISTTQYRQDGVTNTYYDGAPFVKVAETIKETPISSKTIEFGEEYHIDFLSYKGDILLPLVTASNMFQGPTMLTVFYSKECIYFVDPNDPTYDTTYLLSKGDRYMSTLQGFFEGGMRSQDQADLSYHELCFLIDNYYGRPGRETLHSSLEEYDSLDLALEHHDETTKKVKELLTSKDQGEYLTGLFILSDYLYDAGHTVLDYGINQFVNNNPELADKINENLNEVGYVYGSQRAKANFTYSYIYSLYDKYGSDDNLQDLTFHREGDTLLFTFNSFYFNVNKWNDYYDGKGAMPMDEVVGVFKQMLDHYKDSTTVKNVVINLAMNGGGFGDVVVALMALMGKTPYIHFKDMTTGNINTTTYKVDKNFDGQFNEEDETVTYPFNFGILTSAYSFSCANLLPALCKENGIMILGDKSGGGSCAVLDTCTTEGFYARISSQFHMLSKENEEVEMGVIPDRYLYEGDNNFDKMFNITYLSQAMNEFYGE